MIPRAAVRVGQHVASVVIRGLAVGQVGLLGGGQKGRAMGERSGRNPAKPAWPQVPTSASLAHALHSRAWYLKLDSLC